MPPGKTAGKPQFPLEAGRDLDFVAKLGLAQADHGATSVIFLVTAVPLAA